MKNENIVYIKNDNVEYIQFKKLLEYEDILTHAFTLRDNLNFAETSDDKSPSYEKISNCLELKVENNVIPNQTHSDIVRIITEKDQDLKGVDGTITNIKDLSLYIRVADCIALMLFDPANKVIGNVHSGWKGTLQEIIKKAVNKMIDEYNSNPEEIICCICPSIRSCCFEVDEDVKDLFQNTFSKMKNIITKGEIKDNKQKYYIDTVQINKNMLLELGLKQENIIDCDICCLCNADKFHSFRKDGNNSGRCASIISLK